MRQGLNKIVFVSFLREVGLLWKSLPTRRHLAEFVAGKLVGVGSPDLELVPFREVAVMRTSTVFGIPRAKEELSSASGRHETRSLPWQKISPRKKFIIVITGAPPVEWSC